MSLKFNTKTPKGQFESPCKSSKGTLVGDDIFPVNSRYWDSRFFRDRPTTTDKPSARGACARENILPLV